MPDLAGGTSSNKGFAKVCAEAAEPPPNKTGAPNPKLNN
jgi:hypothetical protein